MKLKNKEAWESWVSKNTDDYGKACIDVARGVMEELDNGKDFDCHKIISDADDRLNIGGITGFMAGAVAQMVVTCHERGKEFQKQWNKEYGVEDSKGVVNPALLTISLED